ncbi:MAG: ArsR/SmtB family transcription factor [Demequina sp.]
MTAPQRRLDAAALKGLAHPLRVDILDSLVMAGPATASLLAQRLSESSGATSYHLRQLARHGFVEEDPDRGTGRERWWRMVPGGVTLAATEMRGNRAAMESTMLVARQFADQRARHIDRFLRQGEAELGSEWVDSSILSSATVRLTRAELDELSTAVEAFVEDQLAPYRGRDEPSQSQVVALHVNAFPVVGLDGGTPE